MWELGETVVEVVRIAGVVVGIVERAGMEVGEAIHLKLFQQWRQRNGVSPVWFIRWCFSPIGT